MATTDDPAQAAGVRKVREASVLVVDDDDLITELLDTALSSAGYRVTVATSGADALGQLEAGFPDLVISDINMPELDGFELLAALRQDPVTRWMPVILLTSRTDVEDVVAGLGLGADDYVTKPFQIPELLARVEAKLARPPVPAELLGIDQRTGLLTPERFREEVDRELLRFGRGGRPGCVAVVNLAELDGVELRLGSAAADLAIREITGQMQITLRPLDVLGRLDSTHVGVLLPEASPEEAKVWLQRMATAIAGTTVSVAGARLRATPSVGLTSFAGGGDQKRLLERATIALDYATAHLDLQPLAYEPRMDAVVEEVRASSQRLRHRETADRVWRRARTPSQLVMTIMVGFVLPFILYWRADVAGFDITPVMYLVVVVALTVTGALIFLEGVMALRSDEPPEEPGEPYPPASAIIAAYLPNEAATIRETIEAFLRLDYPAPLQVILAYNTPSPMAVETVLAQLAEDEERFTALRMEGSTSKAQNVNGALPLTTGTFVGVFDADHQPDPDSFRRAWRWLSSGYDVVQGHCLVRNGESSFIARMVAVEFEGIYAVSHPGRARLHGFGIFGGSNGYWRTDRLHEIRMRSSMLTEDIDSSLRVLLSGGRVKSDRNLISRELATTTLRQVWNQRMRWAQGWFQVSLEYLWTGLRSRRLTLRQKFGLVHLLGWREIYPWLSWQVFPIIAYWTWRGDGLDLLVPIFVLTSLFTMSVGPFQTYFAYRLADSEVGSRKRWFVQYLLFSSLFYTEYKNLVARVAQVKEAMGERDWRVTPRSAAADDGGP